MTRLILLGRHSASRLTTSRSDEVIKQQLRGTTGRKKSALTAWKRHSTISWRVSVAGFLFFFTLSVVVVTQREVDVKSSRVIFGDDRWCDHGSHYHSAVLITCQRRSEALWRRIKTERVELFFLLRLMMQFSLDNCVTSGNIVTLRVTICMSTL